MVTKPVVLFSLKYGDQPDYVGLYVPGPEEGEPTTISDFAIGTDGSIYIADNVNKKVKKFSRDGKLLMMTEGDLEGIQAITVDPKGRLFVCFYGDRGISNQLAIYDKDGKRLSEDEKKVRELFKGLTSKTPRVKKETLGYDIPRLSKIWCDSSGNIHFRGGNLFYEIDPKLSQIEFFENKFPYVNRKRYSYELLRSNIRAEHFNCRPDGSIFSKYTIEILRPVEITIYNQDGSVGEKFILPRDGFGEIERLVPSGGGIHCCDQQGHFFMIRQPLKLYGLALMEKNKTEVLVGASYAVCEYDEKGKFIGIRVLLNAFYMSSIHWIEVDPQGNIYYLDFKSDHVDVMMAPAPKVKRK
ncbi:MAG: hypothetical protein NC906_06210 [Candidatus Omnitrophica bacterium]|nr:hypothetical protein [Candidatus Omnitrophota bacterium]